MLSAFFKRLMSNRHRFSPMAAMNATSSNQSRCVLAFSEWSVTSDRNVDARSDSSSDTGSEKKGCCPVLPRKPEVRCGLTETACPPAIPEKKETLCA